MPTLEWIGKDKVVNHHMDVPFRVLEKKYVFGDGGENMIIHGDNLAALKSLLPRFEGRVKQRQRPEDKEMARRGCRQGRRGSFAPRQMALHDVPKARAATQAACGRRRYFHQH